MSKASSKVIVRGEPGSGGGGVQNSDPHGRKHDNIHPSYFGATPKRGRATSMSGLRPSFFAMMRQERSHG